MATRAGQIEVLSFSLRGKMAFFRQPDTTITQATYPFPPRPTLHGILGTILGIDSESEEWKQFLSKKHYIGVAFKTPIRTICVQMSLLGKGFVSNEGDFFNRPTVIELVVSPHYQIYYTGDCLKELKERIREKQSVYHVYLGAAFCLTFPEYQAVYESELLSCSEGEILDIDSVIPQNIVGKIKLQEGAHYRVARAMPYQHLGDRTFKETIYVYYNVAGKPIKTEFIETNHIPYYLVELPTGEKVCLW